MPTVLIVEDEAIIRDMVAEELEDAGFTVVIAVNADHAISILENRLDIHLVFTDIDMSWFHGRFKTRRSSPRSMASHSHHHHDG